jgi:tetratricopeptide (TPR) repeat protein
LSKATTVPKKKNWRNILLLVILAVIVLGACGLVVLRLRSGRRAHLQKAFLYRQAGNYAKAAEEYRLAIESAPDEMDAREGLVRALVFRKEFDEAGKELDAAIEHGLAKNRAVILRSAIMGQRADHRLKSEGAEVSGELIRRVLEEDVDPAAAMLRKAALESVKPSDNLWNMLGEMLSRKQRMLIVEWRLLHRDLKLALDLSKTEDVARLQMRIADMQDQMIAAQKDAVEAYRRAIEIKPQAAGPRVAVAEQAVSSYVPRLAEAREVLAPLLTQSPVPVGALHVMAIVERYADNPEKSLEYVNALIERDPNRFEYFTLKAELLLEMGRFADAAPVMAELAKRRPEDPTTHYEQGRLYLAEGRIVDAANHLQLVFSHGQRAWPQARLLLAQALLKQGSAEQGILNLRRVLEDVKASTISNVRIRREVLEARYDACLGLAAQSQIIGGDEAREFAAQAFRLFPTRKEAFAILTELCRRTTLPAGSLEEVVLYHAVALMQQPNGSDAALAACEEWLPTLMEGQGKAPRLRTLQAAILVSRGDYREAVAAYEGLWADFPDNRGFGYALARFYGALGQIEKAKEVFERLHAVDPSDIRALGGVVLIEMQSGNMESAKALLEKAEASQGREKVRDLLIGLYADEGNYDAALTLARENVEAQPDSATAHLILANLLWRRGDTDAAREEFNAALKIAPKLNAAYMRALLDVETGRLADASELLQRATNEFPGDPQVIASLAVTLHAEGKTDDAVSLLSGICRPDAGPQPALDGPRRNLMFIHAGEGRLEEAEKWNALLTGVNWGFPEDRLGLIHDIAALGAPAGRAAAVSANLIGLYANGGLFESALKETRRLEEAIPANLIVACWEADLIDRLDHHDEAVKAYEGIIAKYPRSVRPRLTLAQSYLSHDDSLASVRVLEECLQIADLDQAARIHLQLAGIHERLGQLDEAVENYQAAVANKRTAVPAGNNLAWLLAVRRGDPPAALPYAQRAAELAPQDPAILDTFGWVLYLSGRNAEAVETLRKARQGLPTVPTVRYHLGVALLARGDVEAGKAELQEALALSQDFPEAAAARQALKEVSKPK